MLKPLRFAARPDLCLVFFTSATSCGPITVSPCQLPLCWLLAEHLLTPQSSWSALLDLTRRKPVRTEVEKHVLPSKPHGLPPGA